MYCFLDNREESGFSKSTGPTDTGGKTVPTNSWGAGGGGRGVAFLRAEGLSGSPSTPSSWTEIMTLSLSS